MENLIAQIFADHEGISLSAQGHEVINDERNKTRFSAAPLPSSNDLDHRASRESAAPLESVDESDLISPKDWPSSCLQLTFSHAPKSGLEFLLGTDPNACDIVLPPLKHISRRHCYITFDSKHHLVLRDCSGQGTTVVCGSQDSGRRRKFTWIIGGHPDLKREETIIVRIHKQVSFKILAAKLGDARLYNENVDRFRRELHDNNQLPFSSLIIQSMRPTAICSDVCSPSSEPFLLRCEDLGRGSFSAVHRAWDVSSGTIYAVKEFYDIERSDWKAEASLMKQISRDHIVKLAFVSNTAFPSLVLEYLSLGNLHDQHQQQKVSKKETVLVLRQSLSALSHLHRQSPAIVHRDIKPANILVQSRTPLHIKLADFGLSKAADYLATYCGTFLYIAYEIFTCRSSAQDLESRYTKAVDIWSLGVVVYEYAYGLPPPPKNCTQGFIWVKRVIAKFETESFDPLIGVLASMLALSPERRASAADCLTESLLLPNSGLDMDHKACETGVGAVQPQGSSGSTVEREHSLTLPTSQGADSHANSPNKGQPDSQTLVALDDCLSNESANGLSESRPHLPRAAAASVH